MIAQITTAELREKIDRGDRFTLVESMPEEYYRAGHLPGAINLPPREEAASKGGCSPKGLPHGDYKTIRIFGRTPPGYSHLRYYEDGKEQWAQAGKPLR